MATKQILVFTLIALSITANGKEVLRNSPGMQDVDINTLHPLYEAENVVRGAIYADPSANAADRAYDLIRRMTFEEKLTMTGGWNRFLIPGVERLGIRPVSTADASQGVRLQTAIVKKISTSFPGMLPLASTWNPELAGEMSSALAEECRALGVDVLLGPGANMQRLSVGGRNFEYMGEDPYLVAVMETAFIKNLQDNGIIATAKHFIGNDQDFCRHITNSEIDERTLREIYLYPWEKMICEGGCLGIMTGNNLVNGFHNAMNRDILSYVLRREFGFRGLIMTDWQSTNYYPDLQHLVLTSGHSLLMPQNDTFRAYVESETVNNPDRKAEVELLLENMIFPIFYTMFKMGVYDRPVCVPSNFDLFEKHKKVAAAVATESAVLIKNEKNILPLKKGQKILLMGSSEIFSGTGSGYVAGYDHISFEAALHREFGDDFSCIENPDDDIVRSADVVLFRLNKPAGEGFDIPFEEPCEQLERLRHTSKINKNVVVLVNACNGLPTDWLKSVKGAVWCYFLGQERGTAIASLLSGRDNFSGKLPFTLEKSFIDSPAPFFNFIGGKPFWRGNNEYKNYWLYKKDVVVEGFSDFVDPGEVLSQSYSEGIFMGYRWYDKKDIRVAFPFGYGLSYTSFLYEDIIVTDRLSDEGKVNVKVTVKNTGNVLGKEVVQVYVSDPECSVERPEKELKAFSKVEILPGESKTVSLDIDIRDFCFWDIESHSWKLESGEFIISAGGSSADLPLKYIIEL